MSRLKVYCEPGGMRNDLRRLRDEGRIRLILFPYEETSRGTARGKPSKATWGELNVTWEELGEITWNDFAASEKFESILDVLGPENEVDAKHLDSAYKEGCQVFFTRDRRDILSNAGKIRELLNIKCFHPDSDWKAFLRFLDSFEQAFVSNDG